MKFLIAANDYEDIKTTKMNDREKECIGYLNHSDESQMYIFKSAENLNISTEILLAF